jgi:hypothetical protein
MRNAGSVGAGGGGNHEFDKIFESIQRDHSQYSDEPSTEFMRTMSSAGLGNGNGSGRGKSSIKDVSSYLNSESNTSSTAGTGPFSSSSSTTTTTNAREHQELTSMLTMTYEILIKLVDGFLHPLSHSHQQQEQQQQFYLAIIQVIRENVAFEKFLSVIRHVVQYAANANADKHPSHTSVQSSDARMDLFALYLLEVNQDLMVTWQQALAVLDHIFAKVTVKTSTSTAAAAATAAAATVMPIAAQQLSDFFAYYEPIFLFPIIGISSLSNKNKKKEERERRWLTLSQLKLTTATYRYLLALSHLSPSQQAFDMILTNAAAASVSSTSTIHHMLMMQDRDRDRDSASSSSSASIMTLSTLTYELMTWLSSVFVGQANELMSKLIIFTTRDAKAHRLTSSTTTGSSQSTATGRSEEDGRKRVVGFGTNQIRTFAVESASASAYGEDRESNPDEESFNKLSSAMSMFTPKRSILKSPKGEGSSSKTSLPSMMPMNAMNATTAASTSTLYMKAVNQELLTVMTMLMKTITLVMPAPFDTEHGDPVIEVGKKVFYLSEKTGYLCEGLITRLNKNDKSFDVVIRGKFFFLLLFSSSSSSFSLSLNMI